jgi:hypothetical protein
MSGRMNWDRVRKQNLVHLHGSERANPSTVIGESIPTSQHCASEEKFPMSRGVNCDWVCPECHTTLAGPSVPQPEALQRLLKHQQDRHCRTTGQSTLRIERPSAAPMAGCTCGKSIGFTGLHKKRCPLCQPQPCVAEKLLLNTKLEHRAAPASLTEFEHQVARATLSVLKQFERRVRSNDLKKPENIQRILKRVQTAMASEQGELAVVAEQVDVPNIVSKTIDFFIEYSIDIPQIVVVPKGEAKTRYRDFDPNLKGIRLQPVAKDILVSHLNDQTRYRPEARLEDYVVRGLVDFDDVSYDDHRELLYKFADAVVQHLKSYLVNENDVRNVLQFNQANLVNIVHSQMQEHREDEVTEYEAYVKQGFRTVRPNSYSIPVGETTRNFRRSVKNKLRIRGMLFSGFKRCLSPFQRFQSDAERRFAVLLETQSDPSILKWFKPGNGVFQIHSNGDTPYEPDFMVETKTAKLICEIKSMEDITTDEVQDKADAAVKWCEYATAQENQNGGKPWSYWLISNDNVLVAGKLQDLEKTSARTSQGTASISRQAIPKTNTPTSKANSGYVSPYKIAQFYADLGDKNQAFRCLNAAYQQHDILLVDLRTDPQFDSLRSDPRYAELLRRIGLSASTKTRRG